MYSRTVVLSALWRHRGMESVLDGRLPYWSLNISSHSFRVNSSTYD